MGQTKSDADVVGQYIVIKERVIKQEIELSKPPGSSFFIVTVIGSDRRLAMSKSLDEIDAFLDGYWAGKGES